MEFEDLRAELAKNEKLKDYIISDYYNAGGYKRNNLLQIYKDNWMPCKFHGQPLELHFEIQSDRILRLDCHWYKYAEHKNYKSKTEFAKSFPNLAVHIKERQQFMRALSADAEQAYQTHSRKRQLRFNALSGIEWTWGESCDWQDISDEIAEIVTAVTPCIDKYFGKELDNY